MSFTAGAGTRFLVTSAASQASGTALTGPLSITGGTATANAPVLNATQTWNNAAVTFTGWQLNVTDTASNANSLLMDLQVGGVRQLSVNKLGTIFSRTNGATDVLITLGGTRLNDYASYFSFNNSVASTVGFSFITAVGVVADLFIARDAANTLAQRNGVNAQTLRVYGTFTDASNYRRLAMAMTTGGVASIAPEGAGTGASGNVLHISGLPTANPGPGILWNDAGTVKVGT